MHGFCIDVHNLVTGDDLVSRSLFKLGTFFNVLSLSQNLLKAYDIKMLIAQGVETVILSSSNTDFPLYFFLLQH